MVLWTIQHRAAYEKMLRTGVLRADPTHIDEDFHRAYVWMAEQMEKRVGKPPERGMFPLWAWYQWEGKRKRPDMRTHGRGWGEAGTPLVLLTLDVPEKLVLLSDFDHWHVVLNDGEMEVSTAKEIPKEKGWEWIFDISCGFAEEPCTCLTTQATLWEIKKEWILKGEFFTSR